MLMDRHRDRFVSFSKVQHKEIIDRRSHCSDGLTKRNGFIVYNVKIGNAKMPQSGHMSHFTFFFALLLRNVIVVCTRACPVCHFQHIVYYNLFICNLHTMYHVIEHGEW